MQSSFKVIKDTKVVAQGSKPIITQYSPTNNTISTLDNDDEKSIDYNASLQLLNDAKEKVKELLKKHKKELKDSSNRPMRKPIMQATKKLKRRAIRMAMKQLCKKPKGS